MTAEAGAIGRHSGGYNTSRDSVPDPLIPNGSNGVYSIDMRVVRFHLVFLMALGISLASCTSAAEERKEKAFTWIKELEDTAVRSEQAEDEMSEWDIAPAPNDTPKTCRLMARFCRSLLKEIVEAEEEDD